MSTVLFLNGPASGHVYPTLGLVEELVALGEKVVYVASEDFRETLERLGSTFVAYDNFLSQEDPFQTKHYLSLVIKILSSYEVILPSILELSKSYKFDYIIHDSMYGCGNVVATLLGIPNVSTCTSFIHAERLLSHNTKKSVEMMGNLGLIKKFIALSTSIQTKYNLQRKLEIGDVFFNEGLLNLVYTSEYFQPSSETIENHYKFVGPNITNRYASVQLPDIAISSQRTIYISMGTVFNDVISFYQLCFEALASFDGHVVLSVGNRIKRDELEGIPDNFTVLPFVPQLQVLSYTDLFITHGGMNSVNEALYFNVPLIVIPMAADQPIVADRIVELGAGIKLDRDSLTAGQLRDSVQEVLQAPHYRTNSSRIGESLHDSGGQKQAIKEILIFKQNHGIA
jgi:MGT family glycosyltransferase